VSANPIVDETYGMRMVYDDYGKGNWIGGVPELGQLSAHLSAGGAIDGIAEVPVQDGQLPDLHRPAPQQRPTSSGAAHVRVTSLLHDPDLVRKSARRERQNPRSAAISALTMASIAGAMMPATFAVIAAIAPGDGA
jgi:hypothetical protein